MDAQALIALENHLHIFARRRLALTQHLAVDGVGERAKTEYRCDVVFALFRSRFLGIPPTVCVASVLAVCSACDGEKDGGQSSTKPGNQEDAGESPASSEPPRPGAQDASAVDASGPDPQTAESAPVDSTSPAPTDASEVEDAGPLAPTPSFTCDGAEGQEVIERCQVGQGICERRGILVCENGEPVCTAVPGPPSAESCNAIDDDCDGEIDEDFNIGKACTEGVGRCQGEGTWRCSEEGQAECGASTLPPTDESCNEIDDNCDGVVDNQHVCPDSSVQNTEAFDDAVWLVIGESSNCGSLLFQAWPVVNQEQTFDRQCYDKWALLRSDGELFSRGENGIAHDVDALEHEWQATPGCEVMGNEFGFDADNRLYYRCYETLWRDAEQLSEGVEQILGITADARAVVQERTFIRVLGADGSERRAHDLKLEFRGDLEVAGTSVHGNNVYIAYRREITFGEEELVVVRINEQDELLLVRRMPILTSYVVPTADGSVFETGLVDSTRVLYRHTPEGDQEIAWSQTDVDFEVYRLEQLLVGPKL